MASTTSRLPCDTECTADINDSRADGIILVANDFSQLAGDLLFLKEPLEQQSQIDSAVCKEVVLLPLGTHSAKRLVYAPTGPLNRDYDDVRRFGDAAGVGIKRAIRAGMKKPMLICVPHEAFPEAKLACLLGAFQSLYVPLEIREDVPSRATKIDQLLVWSANKEEGDNLVKQASGIEGGRLVARDIGGSDPERMAAPKVAEYVYRLFKGTPVKFNIISDDSVLTKEYPLFSAVNRCAKLVDRHQGRVIHLEYVGDGDIETTLMIVGKGVTYDTGGADVKAGGHMAGMHRDKCGAAAVAGFFHTLNCLKPKNIKVVGIMAMVRNSIGVESYVADELIASRAGKRIRIGNTDAEGRMAMADCLCQMKEKAQGEVNPHLFTIATLTGHAVRAMGPNYSIILDNGPARKEGHAQSVQKSGDVIGDPFEISNIRREDYEFHTGKSEYEDVLQSNNAPSTMTARGHQSPSAFLIMASGLDSHGIDSDQPIKYSHIDIAGSSGPFPGVPTGSPISALAAKYILGL
ncbi:putative aminopeptidase W07G4.4 [Amphiura filiformis]|uniref:putative aminopeptidase W07G4.4 n=1 Tax=Amphiura filiformis TaxID=82378 RepID=UPI003B2157A8